MPKPQLLFFFLEKNLIPDLAELLFFKKRKVGFFEHWFSGFVCLCVCVCVCVCVSFWENVLLGNKKKRKTKHSKRLSSWHVCIACMTTTCSGWLLNHSRPHAVGCSPCCLPWGPCKVQIGKAMGSMALKRVCRFCMLTPSGGPLPCRMDEKYLHQLGSSCASFTEKNICCHHAADAQKATQHWQAQTAQLSLIAPPWTADPFPDFRQAAITMSLGKGWTELLFFSTSPRKKNAKAKVIKCDSWAFSSDLSKKREKENCAPPVLDCNRRFSFFFTLRLLKMVFMR